MLAAAAVLPAGCGAGDGEDGDRNRSSLRSEEGGDEAGIRVPVRITIERGRVRASDDEAPSFLALRLRVVNRVDRRIRVTVGRAGEDGERLARVTVRPGGREVVDLEGQPTGTLEVRSPEGTAEVAVRPGAG